MLKLFIHVQIQQWGIKDGDKGKEKYLVTSFVCQSVNKVIFCCWQVDMVIPSC